jgi:hypothetical protein
MSNVVEFSPFEDVAVERTAPHKRLPQLSWILAWMFTAMMGLCVAWVIASFLVIFFFADHVLMNAAGATVTFPRPPSPVAGQVFLSDQPLITRVAGFVDIVIAMVPILFVCWHLRGLFGLYARGVVFARQNAEHLKRVGLWLIVWPVAKFGANMLFQLAGGTDKAWAQMVFVYALILGLIVFVIAQVMAFGHEIEQEKDSFI